MRHPGHDVGLNVSQQRLQAFGRLGRARWQARAQVAGRYLSANRQTLQALPVICYVIHHAVRLLPPLRGVVGAGDEQRFGKNAVESLR